MFNATQVEARLSCQGRANSGSAKRMDRRLWGETAKARLLAATRPKGQPGPGGVGGIMPAHLKFSQKIDTGGRAFPSLVEVLQSSRAKVRHETYRILPYANQARIEYNAPRY